MKVRDGEKVRSAYPPDRTSPPHAAAGCRLLLDGVPPRYSTRMKLAFEIPQAQAEKLRTEAERLGLSPEDLDRAALTDLLAAPDAEFQAVAARIVAKNRELYKRLA
jgi:hypothetical protein